MQVKYANFVFYRLLFLLEFVGTVFVSSVILSRAITESVTLVKYLPFSQLHVARF